VSPLCASFLFCSGELTISPVPVDLEPPIWFKPSEVWEIRGAESVSVAVCRKLLLTDSLVLAQLHSLSRLPRGAGSTRRTRREHPLSAVHQDQGGQGG
jgi:hypothetical protein